MTQMNRMRMNFRGFSVGKGMQVNEVWCSLLVFSALAGVLDAPVLASEPLMDSVSTNSGEGEIALGALSFDLPAIESGRATLGSGAVASLPPQHDTSKHQPKDSDSVGSGEGSEDLNVGGDNTDPFPKPLRIPSSGMEPPTGMTKDAQVVQELPPPPPVPASHRLDAMFIGGSDSLVAIALGAAEGTRTPDGAKTFSYYGHTDPDADVWAVGTFAVQQGDLSPQETDQAHLAKLREQATHLQQQASAHNLPWDLETQLNGLDMVNQSPQAALGDDGFVGRLQQAYRMGMGASEAILWARIRTVLGADADRWNGSGIGYRVSGVGYQVSGIGYRVSGIGCRVSGIGCQVSGIGCEPSASSL
jgi:hypothetical protein